MIFERHANLKYKYGNCHFGCRGYYGDTVGKNVKGRTYKKVQMCQSSICTFLDFHPIYFYHYLCYNVVTTVLVLLHLI